MPDTDPMTVHIPLQPQILYDHEAKPWAQAPVPALLPNDQVEQVVFTSDHGSKPLVDLEGTVKPALPASPVPLHNQPPLDIPAPVAQVPDATSYAGAFTPLAVASSVPIVAAPIIAETAEFAAPLGQAATVAQEVQKGGGRFQPG